MSFYSSEGDHTPNLAANVTGTALFGIVLIAQIGMGAVLREWWLFVLWSVAAALEFIGYLGRSLIHGSPDSITLWQMELICLAIGPSFMIRGLYYQISKIITIYGKRYSPVQAPCGVICLILSDLTGMLILLAGSSVTATDSFETGRDIMLAGISVQLLTLAVFTLYLAFLLVRIFTDSNDHRNWNPDFEHSRSRVLFPLWIPSICLSTCLMLVRSIFRVVELSVNENSTILTNERYFLVLDGLMTLLSLILGTVVYPRVAYGRARVQGLDYREKSAAADEESILGKPKDSSQKSSSNGIVSYFRGGGLIGILVRQIRNHAANQ